MSEGKKNQEEDSAGNKDEGKTSTDNQFEESQITGGGTGTNKEIENLPDSVGESLEALVSVVLDSAEVANKSANVAASSTGTLNAGIEKLNSAAKKNARNSLMILGVCGFFLIIGAMLFVFMATKLNSRVGQVDAMLLAVGKRVLEMDSGVDALGQMQNTLEQFNVDQLQLQEKVSSTQEDLRNQIAEAISVSNGLATELPEKTADQVQKRTDTLVQQFQKLSEKVDEQQATIGKLKNDLQEKMNMVSGNIGSVEETLGEISAVKKDVEALVVIQRERYMEKLEAGWEVEKQAQIASEQAKKVALRKQKKIKELRYPRENETTSSVPDKK